MSQDENTLYYASCIRLIHDFIVADGYISHREMGLLGKYEKKYELYNRDYIRLSKTLSFSDALNVLCKRSVRQKKAFLEDLEEICGIGGSSLGIPIKCSPKEARLLLAVRRVLKNRAIAFTLDKPWKISKKEIIYLEGAKLGCKSLRDDINKSYVNFKSRLAIYGLDFSTVEQVNHKLIHGDENVHFIDGCINGIRVQDLLEYLYPLKTDFDLRESIVNKLQYISTNEFTTDLLENDTELLRKVGPSLLLKIKDTAIEGRNHDVMDCLIIPIELDLTTTIDLFIAEYVVIANGPFSDFRLNPGASYFNVRGWDKTYLDYVITKNCDNLTVSELKISCRKNEKDNHHTRKHWCIEFIGSDKDIISRWELSPLSLSFYILVLYMSTKGKFVPDSQGLKDQQIANYKDCLDLFEGVYKRIGNSSDKTYCSTFKQMFSKFKTGNQQYSEIPEAFKIKEKNNANHKLWRIAKYDLPITINGNGILAQGLEQFCEGVTW